jgi:hypothetical protein
VSKQLKISVYCVEVFTMVNCATEIFPLTYRIDKIKCEQKANTFGGWRHKINWGKDLKENDVSGQ